MYTLFDFVTSTNAAQYVLSLLFILGFIIFFQILKPKPFEGLLETVADDAKFIKSQSRGTVMQLIRNVAMAPVYIMLYIVSLPFLFIQGMAAPVMTAEWSPVRAYFTGRRARKAKKNDAGERPL